MMKKLLLCGLFAALPMFAVGCGADCESLCEDGKACDGADQSVDCAKSCADAEALNDAASCTSEADTMYDCAGSMDDVCDNNDTSCSAEALAYAGCVLEYCSASPTPSECQ